MAREVFYIEGVPYCIFHWSPNFEDDREPVMALVWLFLLGLPPNFYHTSMLKILTGGLGDS